MASATLSQLFLLLALFATSCIAQAPVATPTVSPIASPSPAVAPPTPSTAPVLAPAPAPAAPTPSPVSGPSPSPSISLAPSSLSPAPSSGPSPAPGPGGPTADLPSGSFADGWVNRALISGTAVAGSFIAVTLM